MTKLVPISGKKLCKILEKLGFEKVYGKGSHIRRAGRLASDWNLDIQTEEGLLFQFIQMRR